jgi:phthalate 4,5-dioxygenase oxygenase subunit
VEDTDYGFRYAAIRKSVDDPENKRFVRITQFIVPFYAPVAVRLGQIFVPLDDYHTASYLVLYDTAGPVDQDVLRTLQGLRVAVDLDSSYRSLRNRENNWLQDREAMKQGKSWTGVHGILQQDNIVQESMGPIANRTKEHLGATDAAVIRMRRIMLESVRRVQEGGDPIGLDRPIDYFGIRDGAGVIDKDTPWQTLLDSNEEQSKFSRYQMFVKR